MTADDQQNDCAKQTTPPASEGDMRIIEKLNHLFRKAGDSPETRLIYQTVLEFQQNNRTA